MQEEWVSRRSRYVRGAGIEEERVSRRSRYVGGAGIEEERVSRRSRCTGGPLKVDLQRMGGAELRTGEGRRGEMKENQEKRSFNLNETPPDSSQSWKIIFTERRRLEEDEGPRV
ncbi:hypothetical protein FQA47_019464 [Oryzias melastigma]|uniref:Uncharacterized protein n=1 Tax=Oryzias melastigma TaxID=30732 RepID=A0A834F7J2_ORYME|nr:hypothetical protein FQA47_019464 [Oryzias melastigma]